MRHIAWAVLYVVAGSGCAESVVESAIALTVERGDGVSTCVRVNLRGKDGTREVGKPEFRDGRVLIGLPQGDEGAEVTFLLAGGTGPTCQPTVPAEVASGTFAFPPGDVLRSTLRLERQSVDGGASSDGGSLPDRGTVPDGGALPDGGTPPDGGIVDADGDGSPLGVDCDDTDPRRTPGKPERCAGGIDDDCDTLTDCEDPSCLNQLCGRLDGGAECQGTQCVETNCQNGADDNLDGGSDCADVSCAMKTCGSAPTGTCENLVCRQPMETVCDDTVSNDGDALVDCQDPDCAGRACSDGNACTDANVCMGTTCSNGTPVQCLSPPSACFMPMGACQSPGGCQYTPAVGTGCSDGFRCTVTDACLADGGCEGTPVVCAQSANPCRQSTGRCVESDGGCLFDVLADGTACSTGNGCTSGEVCLAGTCQGGSTRTCTAGLCQVLLSDTCLGDGGCDVRPADAGAACPGGFCTAAGACERFPYRPSNFDPAVVPADAGPSLIIGCATTFQVNSQGAVTVTSSCGVATPAHQRLPQDGGADLVLITAPSLVIADAGSLTIEGSDFPVAFAVTSDADIGGSLIVSGNGTISGPGGNNATLCATGQGRPGAATGSSPRGGGGGGSFGPGPGANGGAGPGSNPTNTGGSAGIQTGNETLVPLRGGCAGGRGGGTGGGEGGRAGGAVQLSVAGTLRVRGRITSSGNGGLGANADVDGVDGPGGGGGGSGGAILLEAAQVVVTGRLTANGGGGGEGEGSGGIGANGTTGLAAATTGAPGGGGASPDGGNGGRGAARSEGSLPGSAAGAAGAGGGGGGGGVGRIRINAVQPCTGTPATVSPQPSSAHTACHY